MYSKYPKYGAKPTYIVALFHLHCGICHCSCSPLLVRFGFNHNGHVHFAPACATPTRSPSYESSSAGPYMPHLHSQPRALRMTCYSRRAEPAWATSGLGLGLVYLGFISSYFSILPLKYEAVHSSLCTTLSQVFLLEVCHTSCLSCDC